MLVQVSLKLQGTVIFKQTKNSIQSVTIIHVRVMRFERCVILALGAAANIGPFCMRCFVASCLWYDMA